jgi:hypothetical protein
MIRRKCNNPYFLQAIRLSTNIIRDVNVYAPAAFCKSDGKYARRLWRILIFADRASQYIYLNINQLDALNFIMNLFQASTCFEHMCSSSGGQNCTIQPLVSSHL